MVTGLVNRSLFIGGTASHVGKSWFTTAFCRLLRRRGRAVAPFKAQNMSNNSCPTIEGGEIGRAQATQAEACGLPVMADMNPVLLKPNSATGSQIVVNGKVWKNVEAKEYGRYTDELFDLAFQSYQRLASQFDTIVCEGAGSIAEVNLRARDFTNLRFAERIQSPTLLVADIERGGVFASLCGTLDLLPPSQRALVRAFAVNRFRGDTGLFDDGLRFLEERLGIPCLGVFPFDKTLNIAEEDSLAIDGAGDIDSSIAVIRLPRISNFTDFRHLGAIAWITRSVSRQFKTIFIPGTKNPIEDLLWLREQGLDEWIRGQHRGGAIIIGICGGYQILGRRISDPDRLESTHGSIAGLQLLPVDTVLKAPKITRAVKAATPLGQPFQAYEIHMGQTTSGTRLKPFATLADGSPEGCAVPGIVGTYLHGAFESSAVMSEWLNIEGATQSSDATYDRLAGWLELNSRKHVLEALIAQ